MKNDNENYVKSLEMLISLLFVDKTVDETEKILRQSCDDETVDYAIALIAIVLSKVYDAYQKDVCKEPMQ